MDVVFKCLSKGAVDFLVKPIRKNELKHLWQHVWRYCNTVSCFLLFQFSPCVHVRTCTEFNVSRYWNNMLRLPWSIVAWYPHEISYLSSVKQSHLNFQLYYAMLTVWTNFSSLDQSGFSGNESGVLIQKPSSGSENVGHAGNKNGSSGEDDNWNTDLNVNGSDNGSDTQVWAFS